MKAKHLFLIGCFILNTFGLFAQDTCLCNFSGCVGDVKYSVLDPQQFNKINGAGWVLLSGTSLREVDSLYQASPLKGITQISSLPDARGVFIRGMNEGRSKDSGDADGGDSRAVGSFQADQFKSHVHDIDNRNTATRNQERCASGNGENIVCGDENTNATLKILPSGGSETRPRNIALYVYIKIK